VNIYPLNEEIVLSLFQQQMFFPNAVTVTTRTICTSWPHSTYEIMLLWNI